MNIIRFVKDWTLPIAMIAGALSYVVYINIPCLAPTKAFAGSAVAVVQPVLIFCMLFLTFCKIHPRDLRPCRWHLWLLLIQALMFVLPALWLIAFPDTAWRVVIEGGMICMICPTATASAVVAGKLGGNGALTEVYIIDGDDDNDDTVRIITIWRIDGRFDSVSLFIVVRIVRLFLAASCQC